MLPPTCCPQAYWCPTSGDTECPAHGGFDVCCARPDWHISQTRDAWHAEQAAHERRLLDHHARTQLLIPA